MMNPTHRAVLQVLYTMATDDCPADVALIADELGMSCSETIRVLELLDANGWVDANTVRLTMSGLVLAVSAGRRRRASKPTPRRAPERARSRSNSRAA